MGFLSGVVAGVAMAAGAAAWYMSRSGEKFRDQYRVDRKLGELGDEFEARTRDIQSSVNAQIAEMRAKADDTVGAAAAMSMRPSTTCRRPPPKRPPRSKREPPRSRRPPRTPPPTASRRITRPGLRRAPDARWCGSGCRPPPPMRPP